MKEQDIILIEQYLKGKLPADEVRDFENRLKSDQEFFDQFEFIKDTQKALQYSHKETFREKVKDIANEFESEKKNKQDHSSTALNGTKRIFDYKAYAIAASLAVVLVSVYFIWFNNAPISPNQEFIQTYAAKNPESVNVMAPKIYPYDKLNYLGAAHDSIPEEIQEIEFPGNINSVAIININKFKNHYFINDTLYLLGDFNSAPTFFKGQRENEVILKKGLEYFKFTIEKTDTITSLSKITSSLNKAIENE